MSLSVIVCDDSRFARSQLIKSLPHELRTNLKEASDGVEALDLIRNGYGELMFLDLNMPNMDGYQVLEVIQKENLDVLVIVITGDIQESAKKKILALGALAFIQKPLNINELNTVLKNFGLADIVNSDDGQNDTLNPTDEENEQLLITYQEKLQEVVNIAMGQAAKQMADLINLFINLPVPVVSFKTGKELYNELYFLLHENFNLLISSGFTGSEMNGEVMVYYTEEDIDNLLHILVDENDTSSSRKGTMIELSNLIITTLMSGIGELLGSQFSRAHPAIVRLSDKVQLVSPELINKQILNVQLTYTIPDHKIKCKMIILISENSIKSLQKRLSYI